MSPSAVVPEGKPVTVACEDPAAFSPALYAWFHNGRWLQEGPASLLQFPVTTRAHAGAYFCQVHDSQGTRSSRPATLQVLCEQGSLAVALQDEGGRGCCQGLVRVDMALWRG